MVTKLILDTDIGDDIDDALALGLVLTAPELELLGVTTVFKNTLARARQARTVLLSAGKGNIPVAAGSGAVISTRRMYGFDPGQALIRKELPNQDASALPEEQLPPLEKRHAVQFIIDTIMNGSGDIVIATIGALTNLALAMIIEPRICTRIPEVVMMGGTFDRQVSEWNIMCDPVAASVVCESGIPLRIIPLDVTTKVQFREGDLDALRASKRPLAQRLLRAIEAWQQHSGWADRVGGLPVMHDPLAIATMIDASLVAWRTGKVSVELNGEYTYGYTLFREDPTGHHKYAYTVNPTAALDLWIQHVAAD
ncbi:MAG: nucleoside hydrolase [Chloroflexi bacterium]|nr:nucleoside hydrolase [Chloroflexota bacterium]